MKKQVKVGLIVLSLIVSSVLYYNTTQNNSIRSVPATTLAIITALFAVLLVIIAYKELIKRFGKGNVVHADYVKLFDLEDTTVNGEVEFYFTTEAKKIVRFFILDRSLKDIMTVKEGDFGVGGHLVRFNTTALSNGVYFYGIQTDSQKTYKKMTVNNDSLSVN